MSSSIKSLNSLRTKRLLLRHWREADVAPFAALNADPEVMRHFPSPLTREQTEAMYGRILEGFATRGFGLWAVELVASGEFIGFVGLLVPSFEAHFTPCVEIGWRLARKYWGNGYAPEAAREVLRDGFERVGLSEIVSMTATTNLPSMRVMEKIGMVRSPGDDFDHPWLDAGHPLCRHVLYRVQARDGVND
jgi:RimJ/RimL family protein N-acetyltransferase